VQEARLPLFVVTRYENGGAYLFLFLSEPVPASLVKEKLTEWAAYLGYGRCPVHPKQTALAAPSSDDGPQDVGTWLPMPYFGNQSFGLVYDKTVDDIDGKRYNDFTPFTPEDFVTRAMEMRISEAELYSIALKVSDKLHDGPPCLQTLCARPVDGDQRKRVLRNIGVYCKQRYDDWEEHIEEFNYLLIQPPLNSAEMQEVIKSLRRKDVTYSCNEKPLEQHCNRSQCLRSKYGVCDILGGDIVPQNLTIIKTVPPIYYLEVNGKRMQLETNDLVEQRRFRRKCVEEVQILPPMMKQNQWDRLLVDLLENRTEVEAPAEAGPVGVMWSHLRRYCSLSPHHAKIKEDLVEENKIWKENGRLYFKGAGFMQYLERQHFRDLSRSKIWAAIKEGGGKHHEETFYIDGKQFHRNLWSVLDFEPEISGRELPPLDDVTEAFE